MSFEIISQAQQEAALQAIARMLGLATGITRFARFELRVFRWWRSWHLPAPEADSAS